MSDAPSTPPPMPAAPTMKVQWLSWIAASTLLPALPWVVIGKKTLDENIAFVLLGFAVLCQLIASIFVAIGVSKRRSLGTGGIIGLSIVFMMASLAIGTAVFFVACLSLANLNFH